MGQSHKACEIVDFGAFSQTFFSVSPSKFCSSKNSVVVGSLFLLYKVLKHCRTLVLSSKHLFIQLINNHKLEKMQTLIRN